MLVMGVRVARSVLRVAVRGLLALPLTMIAPATQVLVLPGCGCSDSLEPGLSVTVVDGAAGTRICDATVMATDGNHVETLAPFGDSATCQYFGLYERGGTYNVEVASGGRTVSMTNVAVTSDICHVTTRTLTITLPPPTGV